MRANSQAQIELQHRDPENADDQPTDMDTGLGYGEAGESDLNDGATGGVDDPALQDAGKGDDDGADPDGDPDPDGIFGADDMLEQLEDDAEALGAGAWYATCSTKHHPWTGRPRASYDRAVQDAFKHDEQYHRGNSTAGVTN